jgi:hypothetical protein
VQVSESAALTGAPTDSLRQLVVHQDEAHRVLRGVQKAVQLVELAENLKSSGKVLECGAGVTILHATNRVDGRPYSPGQIFLGQMPATTRQ